MQVASFQELSYSFDMSFFHTSVKTTSHYWMWEQKAEIPFDELIVSWNGFRPSEGFWEFSVSLYQKEWSPWLKYAQWGKGHQKTFQTMPPASFAQTHQDVVRPVQGLCTAFRVQVVGHIADLSNLQSLTATSSQTTQFIMPPLPRLSPINLPFKFPQSQLLLTHPRYRDLCSPTSTTAAIHHLLGEKKIDPTVFAEAVRDQHFDIYGNWILNTAAAYEALEGKYHTYVARIHSFAEVHDKLVQGLPVVVSIKGPLEGSPLSYASGHLMLLTGFDPDAKRIYCMDPGFSEDSLTATSYALAPFLEAWGRRRNLAYLFDRAPA